MGTDTERVYQAEMRDIDDPKQHFVSVWAELKQTVVDKAIDQWQTRLRIRIRAKRQYFERLLNGLDVFGQNCWLTKYTARFIASVTFSYVDMYCAHIPLFSLDAYIIKVYKQ